MLAASGVMFLLGWGLSFTVAGLLLIAVATALAAGAIVLLPTARTAGVAGALVLAGLGAAPAAARSPASGAFVLLVAAVLGTWSWRRAA